MKPMPRKWQAPGQVAVTKRDTPGHDAPVLKLKFGKSKGSRSTTATPAASPPPPSQQVVVNPVAEPAPKPKIKLKLFSRPKES
jgi:hypothetical protein